MVISLNFDMREVDFMESPGMSSSDSSLKSSNVVFFFSRDLAGVFMGDFGVEKLENLESARCLGGWVGDFKS